MRSLAFLSTSPVKGGHNSKAFGKKIRSQHSADEGGTNEKGGRFSFQNRRLRPWWYARLIRNLLWKMRDSA